MSMMVQTKYGPAKGFRKNGAIVWLGIPFARPPVGELSFRHPVPPEPWEDVLNADKGSTNPIQTPGGFHIGNNSQDCLYLNVFAPEEATAPMPVMV